MREFHLRGKHPLPCRINHPLRSQSALPRSLRLPAELRLLWTPLRQQTVWLQGLNKADGLSLSTALAASVPAVGILDGSTFAFEGPLTSTKAVDDTSPLTEHRTLRASRQITDTLRVLSWGTNEYSPGRNDVVLQIGCIDQSELAWCSPCLSCAW